MTMIGPWEPLNHHIIILKVHLVHCKVGFLVVSTSISTSFLTLDWIGNCEDCHFKF